MGLKNTTIKLLRRALVEADTPLSAEDLAINAGLSTTTARKYLRAMTAAGEALEQRVQLPQRVFAHWGPVL